MYTYVSIYNILSMLDNEVLNVYTGEYEEHRKENKLGSFDTFIMIFKSSSRLTLFGFHQVYQRSGVYLGLLISSIIIYLLNHSCIRIVRFAEELEKESIDELHIENTNELIGLMEMKWRGTSYLGILITVLIFFSSMGFAVAMCITFKSVIEVTFDLSPISNNLLLFFLTAVLLAYGIEPEKLIKIAYFAQIITLLLIILSIYYSLKSYFTIYETSNPNIKLWRTSEVGTTMGYVISSIELINSILNYRRMASVTTRTRYSKIAYIGLYAAGVCCIIPSLLIYISMEGRGLKDIYFFTFKDKLIVAVVCVCFGVNMILGLAKYIILCLETIEKIKLAQRLMRNSRHELSTIRIFISRLVLLLIFGSISILISDVRKIYSYTGIFINSFIGLIIPASLAFIRPKSNRSSDSTVTRVSDIVSIGVGISTIVIYCLQ